MTLEYSKTARVNTSERHPRCPHRIANPFRASGFRHAGLRRPLPKGDKPQRYQFTLLAVDMDKLPVDENTSGAVVGFNPFGTATGLTVLSSLTGYEPWGSVTIRPRHARRGIMVMSNGS
jgi:hypothetical protein